MFVCRYLHIQNRTTDQNLRTRATGSCFSGRRGANRFWRAFSNWGAMPDKTEEGGSPIEAQLETKTLEALFGEQAELIHRLFAYRFSEFDQKWDVNLEARLASLQDSLESRLEATFNAKLEPLKRDLAAIKHTAKTILTR